MWFGGQRACVKCERNDAGKQIKTKFNWLAKADQLILPTVITALLCRPIFASVADSIFFGQKLLLTEREAFGAVYRLKSFHKSTFSYLI